MGKIFISYRRSDSATTTTHIYRELAKRYGAQNIFFDTETIDGGRDFTGAIVEFVTASDVLLAMIGEEWLNATDDSGNRRIDDPDDFVREEIGLALSLQRVTVIPIVLNNAKMPTDDDLPRKLKDLPKRNAVFVREGRDFENDLGRLISEIDKAMPARQLNPLVVGGALLGVIGLILVIVFALTNSASTSDQVTQQEDSQSDAIIEDNLPDDTASLNSTSIGAPICENGVVKTSGYQGEIIFQRTTRKEIKDDPDTEEDESQGALRDIVSLDLATCQEYWITNTPKTDEQYPIWFGNEVLFTSDREGSNRIVKLDTNTNTVERLTSFAGYMPDISKDGNTIFYQGWSTDNEAWNIFKYEITTDATENLTSSTELEAFPSLSQDGKLLVFHRVNGDDSRDIILLDLNSKLEANLSEVGSPDRDNLHDREPSFSPDGNSIIYTHESQRQDPSSRDIWIMNSDGTNKRALTDNQWAGFAHWSPDGNRIIYSVWEPDIDGTNNWNLWVMDADGTNKVRVLGTTESELYARWRPEN